MEKEIRLTNHLTTEKIDIDEFIKRMEKRFSNKESSLTDSEKRELRIQILKKENVLVLH